MTKIIPLTTQAREISLPPTAQLLIEKGLAPEGMKQFTIGLSKVMCVPPQPQAKYGWFLSMSRPDHVITQDELKRACFAILPTGLKVTGKIEQVRGEDGNFHATVIEVQTESDQHGSRDDTPEV